MRRHCFGPYLPHSVRCALIKLFLITPQTAVSNLIIPGMVLLIAFHIRSHTLVGCCTVCQDGAGCCRMWGSPTTGWHLRPSRPGRCSSNLLSIHAYNNRTQSNMSNANSDKCNCTATCSCAVNACTCK
ncbi:hypothetical protein PAXRUDRAFT_832091 [Paxillus rubicundulus Ve08.2h10]|uniref:Uncharacterized protein n=1 Tax=Paxillus rubicundulus Ve08.2h10 TaxID=930991 RepID=A0A0D0DSX5_9AGAM|nr:hypothetical protein PAXRUDRAFT_832091 [Paxillus rubicundulus Ve08.2h10]